MESIIVSEEIKEELLPTYYSVLPASVRYCKSLTHFEKILYSELSCLTTTKGYCFATNSYFAKIYGCNTKTITRSFSNLEKNGFIKIQLLKKPSGEVVQRRIFLVAATSFCEQPMDKNVSDNIIKSNTIKYNNITENPFSFENSLFTVRSTEKENLNLLTENDNLDFDYLNFKDKERKYLNLDELNYLKSKVNIQDYDIFDKFITKQDENKFVVDKSFRGIFLDTVGVDYMIFLNFFNQKRKLQCNNSKVNDNNVENATKQTRSGHFEEISKKSTKLSTDEKNVQKTRKMTKEPTDLQKIKNYYLENRKKLYEQGKCSSPIDSTNSVVINKRLNDLLKKGVSVEQFYKVFDFAMADKFCIDIDYRFLPLIKENVFFNLYNNKDSHCVEPVKPIEEKSEMTFKNIQVVTQKCKKCDFELDYFGKCPFCDYD